MSKHVKLLPCPFCGGEAEAISLFPNDEHKGNTFVQCKGCKVSSRRGHCDFAITAWNTRAEDPRIAGLEARCAKMSDALNPFSDAFDEAEEWGHDDDNQAAVTVGDCRAAKEALK